MNFAGNFEKIGTTDISDIVTVLATLTDEDWDADAFRQKRYEVHRDTQTVGLVFDPDFRHTHPTRLPMLERFEQALRPVLDIIADHFELSDKGRQLTDNNGLGYFIRATLVRLRSGGAIDEHTDNNFSLTHSHRVHVPLITNDKVQFVVGSESVHMAAGTIYEINNRRLHSVRNDGDADRIHLILDFVLPGEKCCCGIKRHPDTRCSPQACIDTDHLHIACTCFPEA